jgi:mannose-1-phosphate guanylyltransferase/mannose-6-phosphate isomerase
VSRSNFPKQFHGLTSHETLFQEALQRVKDPSLYAAPLVVCNEDHRFLVAQQAEQLNVKLERIVLEPEGRNTAPAVAVASVLVRDLEANGLVLVLASDHHIGDPKAFSEAVRRAIPAAMSGFICTFGVKPTCPETGFGYIKRTNQEVKPGCFRIDQFKEKPDVKTAEQYVADGRYDWNAGIFLFDASKMLSELTKHEPSIVPACEEAVSSAEIDSWGCVRLSKAAFSKAKATSVDYAVMERTEFSAVIQLDAAWTDVGSWPSLHQTTVGKASNSAENKACNNYTHGHVYYSETKNCFLSSDGPVLAAIGVENICAIVTGDAVLVVKMDGASAQQVGAMCKRLNSNVLTKAVTLNHVSACTAWGSTKEIDRSDAYSLVKLTIRAGCRTPSQKSACSRTLTVVEGIATLTCDLEKHLLTEGAVFQVPTGAEFHLVNEGATTNLIVHELLYPQQTSPSLVRSDSLSSRQQHSSATFGRYALEGAVCLLAVGVALFAARKKFA